MSGADAIDALAGIAPGSALDALRRQKPVTRDNAQASFEALFAPRHHAGVAAAERAAVALFVAGLHADEAGQGFYGAMLAGPPALASAVRDAAARNAGQGPYGAYPPGPLSNEDVSGPAYAPGAADVLGARLAAAFAHAHMLVFHPRDADARALRTLEAAGWGADDIVTLSQLVAFLSFQLRAAAGLRVLGVSLGVPA